MTTPVPTPDATPASTPQAGAATPTLVHSTPAPVRLIHGNPAWVWWVVGGVGGTGLLGWLIVVLVTLGAIGGGLGAVGSGDPKRGDVKVTGCELGSSTLLPSADVTVTVTNSSGQSRSYWIDFEIRDTSGARVGSNSIYVERLNSGSKAIKEGTAILDAPASSGSCVITKVS